MSTSLSIFGFSEDKTDAYEKIIHLFELSVSVFDFQWRVLIKSPATGEVSEYHGNDGVFSDDNLQTVRGYLEEKGNNDFYSIQLEGFIYREYLNGQGDIEKKSIQISICLENRVDEDSFRIVFSIGDTSDYLDLSNSYEDGNFRAIKNEILDFISLPFVKVAYGCEETLSRKISECFLFYVNDSLKLDEYFFSLGADLKIKKYDGSDYYIASEKETFILCKNLCTHRIGNLNGIINV